MRPLALTILVLTILSFDLPMALAQEQDEETIEEIVVVGSRRRANVVATSPVPVDVLRGELFRNMGTDDVDDIMRTLVPSYNVRRYPLNDESSLVRPATLRGLPPDNTLILINGKRLHRSAVLAGVLGGVQGPDTSVIAPSSIARVEVLRDGAAAQYGSDAIAGVINIITRNTDDFLSVEYKFGQFYRGDGTSNRISLHGGVPVAGQGFANLSLEYGNSDKTVRAEQRFDARALENLGMTGIPNPAQSWGQPTVRDDWRTFVNVEYPFGATGTVYGTGHYASRNSEIEFFWRNPNGQFGVYTLGPARLVFDLTPDNSGNCPEAFSPNGLFAPDFFFPTQQEYDADQAELAQLAADPNCWVVNEMYPSGYRPDFGADIRDFGTTIGFRDARQSGFEYDVSITHGESKVDYTLRNTLNPSLGPSSPTEFRPGANLQSETSANFDAVYPVEANFLHSPLNIAWGVEWREERYETRAGDPASYEVGPLQSQGASIGSHGYPGFSPDNAGSWSRANWAVYADLEADVTERFLLALALRFEDFEDFGSTTNGKLAARFELTDWIAARGSASTGFRAPTPGQSNYTRLQTELFGNELRQVGLIPPTNPVAEFYGGKPLQPAESENLSAGLVMTPGKNFFLSLDYYRIDIEDDINVGPAFFVTDEDRAELIALGVPGASDFGFITFYANLLEARIEGYDAVASYTYQWPAWGTTRLELAWNNNKVTLGEMAESNRPLFVSEQNQPRNRVTTTVEHNWKNLRLLGRLSFYDSYIVADTDVGPLAPICSDERPNPVGTDECYGDMWVLDLEAAFMFGDRFTLVVGADNVLDEYPDEAYDYPDFSFGQRWTDSSPIGYNGGFWYVRLQADF